MQQVKTCNHNSTGECMNEDVWTHFWNEHCYQPVGFLGDVCPPHWFQQATTCSLSRSRIWFLSMPSQDVRLPEIWTEIWNQDFAIENTPWNYPQNVCCVSRSFLPFLETCSSRLPLKINGQWLGWIKFPFWVLAPRFQGKLYIRLLVSGRITATRWSRWKYWEIICVCYELSSLSKT